jgi:XTP/dITP diphosphohydrolase
MPRIYVATHNAHKIREIGEILPDFEIVADDPEGIEENATDFAGNALIKVLAIAARHRGEWCMADDSGLEVAALGGAPGVRSARYSDDEFPEAEGAERTRRNNEKLLAKLSGVANRAANFTCSIALVDPSGRAHSAEGRCFGTIAEKPSGAAGFGYDPLFVPDGFSKSFAELSADEKNAISHRGRALAEVRRILNACAACDAGK